MGECAYELYLNQYPTWVNSNAIIINSFILQELESSRQISQMDKAIMANIFFFF